MFLDKIEKRSTVSGETNWTSWVKGEDDYIEADSTYYKCINLFAENVAKLPIITKISTDMGDVDADKFYLYEKLRLRPNDSMSAFETIKADRKSVV